MNTTNKIDPPEQRSLNSLNSSYDLPLKWFFITNQSNMMYLLAHGLFLDFRDFGEKYYPDMLQLTAGYVPFFNKMLSQHDMNRVLTENFHFPVVAQISLDGFKGSVQGICEDGSQMNIDLPCTQSIRPIRLILIPAGFATAAVERLIFQSKKDKDTFVEHADNLYNVPVSQFTMETAGGLFSQNYRNIDWDAISQSIPTTDHSPHIMNALGVGGAMAMVYQLAQRSTVASRFYHSLTNQTDPMSTKDKSDPVLSYMPDWVNGMIPYSGSDIRLRLFWDIVQYLVSHALNEDEVQYQVLNILKSFMDDAGMENSVKERLAVLYHDIVGLKGLGGENLSTLFQKHNRPLSMALICLFQYRECQEFLGLSFLTDFDDNSRLTAAVLFGVREKWDRLPNGLRISQSFSRFISAFMMHLSYKKRGHNLKWTTPPKSPQPLAGLLLPEILPSGKQQEKLKETRLHLSRKMKWDCMTTSIDLGPGKYEIEVKSSGVKLRLHGDAKCINTEIESGAFISGLSCLPLPLDEKLEWEIREKLGESQPNCSSGGAKRKNRSKAREDVDQ
jgi:hypothetical protein